MSGVRQSIAESAPAPVPRRALIALDAVTVVYDAPSGPFVAADRVSFTVAEGEFVCLLGPSGCGKSTILNTIAGFEFPYSGAVTVAGATVTGPGPDRGVVFQQPNLFPWKSVRRNVAHGPLMRGKPVVEARAIADRLIEVAGLSRFKDALPHTLSGGMQQRVAIARALANAPQVLLMDEPFGALDAQTRTVMQQHLLELWRSIGTTIVFVTHDIDEALFLADRVIIMSAGPGRIAREIGVALPRPRSADVIVSRPFMELKRACLDLIRAEATRAASA
jgi:NitT/TauT family transport system ATP-binding protein